jgi:hypothetical protein
MAYNFVRASSQYISSSFSGIPVYPVTFSAWAYATNDAAPSAMNVVRWMQAATTQGFSIVFAGQAAGDPIRGNLNTASTASISQFSPGFVINTWHHVCFVCNSSTSRTIYKDGVAGITATANDTPTDLTRLWIGSDGSNNFDGYISDIAIWSVALNTDEINSLAKGFSAKKIRPQSLTYYVPLVRNLQEHRGNIELTNNNAATVVQHNRIYS